MNRLYWVRHGESPANIAKVFSYKLADYSLTLKGRLQAQQTAEYFLNMDIHEIYSSPVRRARETAEIIATRLDLGVSLAEDFLEVNIGEFDGRSMRGDRFSFHQKIVSEWYVGKRDARFPGGEDYDALWERMRNGYEKVFKNRANRNVIIVGHGGSFKYTLKELCRNVDTKTLRSAAIHNCSITEVIVRYQNENLEGELISLASCAHISGTASEFIPGLPQVSDCENGEALPNC